jgi:hypothetical protein
VAGDLPLAEHPLILAEDEALRRQGFAPSVVEADVVHEFGPRVRIHGWTQLDRAIAPAPVPTDVKLDIVGELGLRALAARNSNAFKAAKKERPLAAESWGTDAAAPPDGASPSARPLTDAGSPAPPPQPMLGRIALGLVIVDGPSDDLRFTDDQRVKVVSEVQEGLSWLGSKAPSTITWSYDIQTIEIGVTPDPAVSGFEPLEAQWRDPALAALGHQPGMSGCADYVEAIKTRLGCEHGYCTFVVKYPLAHFAYASIGGPRLVMNYDLDGWMTDNFDSVFAHESGHIFGAPDEYAESGCDCGGRWGTSQGPNANCESCAPGEAVDCIMLRNMLAICPATIGHFGWA